MAVIKRFNVKIKMSKYNNIMTALVKIHFLGEEILKEVAELEAMRKGINERQRANLEMKISNRKEWVKTLYKIDSDLRDEL